VVCGSGQVSGDVGIRNFVTFSENQERMKLRIIQFKDAEEEGKEERENRERKQSSGLIENHPIHSAHFLPILILYPNSKYFQTHKR
jgi:hypothetical protein